MYTLDVDKQTVSRPLFQDNLSKPAPGKTNVDFSEVEMMG